jgi:hypothetical protein
MSTIVDANPADWYSQRSPRCPNERGVDAALETSDLGLWRRGGRRENPLGLLGVAPVDRGEPGLDVGAWVAQRVGHVVASSSITPSILTRGPDAESPGKPTPPSEEGGAGDVRRDEARRPKNTLRVGRGETL